MIPNKRLNNANMSTVAKYPESFTISEFIETERGAEPKGKKWLFILLIVLVLLKAIVMIPYNAAISIYKWFKKTSVTKS
jgi:hypothetical protein